MKKSIAILLIVTLILSSVSVFASTYDDDNDLSYLSNWTEYKRMNGIPSVTPTKSDLGKPFNAEIWQEIGIVVFGDWSLVPRNDFKPVSGGYYEKDGQRGEYRYHGYDQFDNQVTNDQFPRDASSSTKAEDKRWGYMPWNNSSFAKALYTKTVGQYDPTWNLIAINGLSESSSTVAKQINTGLEFVIKNGTFTGFDSIGDSPINGSIDPMYYSVIQSLPSSTHNGQAVMFHKSKYDGRAWYQTFPIAKLGEKDYTPVTAEITSISTKAVDTSGNVTLTVEVLGTLMDESYFVGGEEEEILLQTHYYRRDVKKSDPWTMELTNSVNGRKQTIKGQAVSQNSAKATFDVEFTNAEYLGLLNENNEFNVDFNGSAEVTFFTGETSIGYTDGTSRASGGAIDEEDPYVGVIEYEVTAPYEILDKWTFPLSVNEIDMEYFQSKHVDLNGKRLSDSEMNKFLSGNWKFPEIGEDKLYPYEIVYVATDGDEYIYRSFVLVYDSIPRAEVRVLQDSGKINRQIGVSANKDVTPLFVRNNSTVTISSFTVTSQEGYPIYYGTNTSSLKEFLMKQIGTVTVTATVSNQYGSRSYSHEIYVGEDYEPDITAIIWNNNLARQDELDIFAEGASLDGDTIGAVNYEIYFDENKDDVPEKLVFSGVWEGSTTYQPDKLGKYEMRFTTTEIFGEETIEAYVTPDDRKSITVTREFFVDNLVPMTKIYTDIEYNFPNVDVAMILDQDYPSTAVQYVKDNAVNITNSFRVNSMLANVDTWDTHTYVFSQTAYKRTHTGSSYPSSTTSYSADGYTGTLSRYDVDNYPYQVDRGGYESQTSTKTVSQSASNTERINYRYNGSSWVVTSTYNPQLPSSKSYSSDGYTGTIYKDSSTASVSWSGSAPSNPEVGDTYTRTGSWSVYYKGTVSKTVSVWVSDWRTYNDYYGDYSGTVYKNVKQDYLPSYDVESSKYIVYFAQSGINNIADFNYVKNIAKDAHVILVGDVSLKGQLGEKTFIDYTTDTQSIIDTIVTTVKGENTIINEMSLLSGETFTMSFTDVDPENDTLLYGNTMQYVHDHNYFDNPQSLEVGAYPEYLVSQFGSTIKTSFTNVGKYTIYRRIADEPTEDPTKGLYSNVAQLDIYVHRPPVADYTLDWVYDAVLGNYQTTWVDKSYDPDFQYSDPDKGIVDRKIKYRRNGGAWIYEIPQNLVSGNYDLEYMVMDNFGVWSPVKTQSFTLASAPPVQLLNAELRALLYSKFSLTAIPSSEDLEFRNVQTRYPYEEHLAFGIYNTSGSIVTSQATKYYNASNDSMVGQDIYWSNTTYNIPSTLPDGNYTARVYLIADAMPSNFTYEAFPITVKTPVNLDPTINNTVSKDSATDITATTSKYVSSLQVELFDGTGYEVVLNMVGVASGDTKNWTYSHTELRSVPEGNYNARFVARTPNGNQEVVIRPFAFVWNRPPVIENMSIDPSVPYEGDNLYLNYELSDPDMDDLTIAITLRNSSNVVVGTVSKVVNSSQYVLLDRVKPNIASGNYTLELKVTDIRGEVDTQTIPVLVNAHSVTGTVSHNATWDANRIEYNQYKTGTDTAPRTPDTFWSTEEFILNSTTTNIHASSSDVASRVNVQIRYEGYSTDINTADNENWSLTWWEDTMMNAWGRPPETLTFRFTAYFTNNDGEQNTIKTYDVDVTIDNEDPYHRDHRNW